MLRFGKVSKIKGEKDEKGNLKSYETKDAKQVQKEYETKVNSLLEYCMKFKTALNSLASKDWIFPLTAKDIKNCFNNSFKDYFKKFSKKFGLFSRTTKVLKGMDKELEKLGNLELVSKGAIAKIRDAFEYKREMPKDGLIKRSAIDDKAVYGFFNGTLPGIIENLVSNKQKAEEKEEDKIKFIEESLKNAKFENRLVTLQNKIQEIKDDLKEIKAKQAEYEVGEKSKKAFKKSNELTEKIRKSVTEISDQVDTLSKLLKNGKKGLENYKNNKENVSGEEFESNVAAYKKEIRETKNSIDKYSKELKKLKSDTKKAAEKSNEILKKLEAQKGAVSLKNGTLTINGDEGLKVWKIYDGDHSEEGDKFTGIKTIVLKDVSDINVTGIFNYLEGLTSVDAKSLNGKSEISKYAFDRCEKLNFFNNSGNGCDYNIPVKEIGNYAFYGAGTNVPSGFSANVGATTINSYAFAESGLKEIILPNVTKIGGYAFANCTKLKTVILGQNITANKVDKNAFANTKDLTIYVRTEELQKELKKKFSNVNVEVEKQL